jgi:hypothetical protein
MPVEPYDVPAGNAVERYQGYFLIEPPGQNVRLWLDPETAIPKRVDLLNDAGRKVVSAVLREPRRVAQADMPRRQWPFLAHETKIYVFEENARMRLELSNASDGQAEDKINPKVCDFDTLMQVQDPAELIDLDADCYDSPAGLGLEPAATQPRPKAPWEF